MEGKVQVGKQSVERCGLYMWIWSNQLGSVWIRSSIIVTEHIYRSIFVGILILVYVPESILRNGRASALVWSNWCGAHRRSVSVDVVRSRDFVIEDGGDRRDLSDDILLPDVVRRWFCDSSSPTVPSVDDFSAVATNVGVAAFRFCWWCCCCGIRSA